MSLLKLLNISKQGLLAQQRAIDITANNIANVNTRGYRRRQVDLTDLTSSNSFLGFSQLNGLYTQGDALHIRQRFVEHQLNLEYQNLGRYEMDENTLTQVENIFGEPQDSALSNVMSQFWNSWSDLSNDPQNTTARGNVKDKGVQLASTFNRIHSDLTTLNNQMVENIQNKTGEINQLLNQIQSINESISTAGSLELVDQRDTVLNELSGLINMEVNEDANGSMIVSTGGHVLLHGNFINHVSVDITSDQDLASVEMRLSSGNQKLEITSGELGSMLTVTSNDIPVYLEQLDELAVEISRAVNDVHITGFNLDGVTGNNFFDADMTGAGDMAVDSGIMANADLIATASSMDAEGDGSIALEISDLQSESFVGGTTASDFYNAIMGKIGNSVQEAGFMRNNQEMLVQSLQNQRDSASGVSLDEEMTRLIEFERGYEAAARMISVIDELMTTTINMV